MRKSFRLGKFCFSQTWESGKFKMKTLTGLVSGQGYCLRKYLLLSGRKAEPNTVLTAWEMLKGRGYQSTSTPFSPYTDANTRLNPADCMLPWRSSQHHNLGSQVPACVDGLERYMSVMEEILQYPYNLNILKIDLLVILKLHLLR